MTTTVTVTGTGVPHIAPGRAGAGTLVEWGDVRLQFDAGRATALRLVEAGVRTGDLSALFITHHHSDHLTGMTDLLFSRWLENLGRFEPLPVIAPDGPVIELLEHLLDPWHADIAIRSEHVNRTDHPAPNVIPFDAATAVDEPIEVWASPDGNVRVLTRAVHHEPVTPAVAYRVETPDGAVVVSGDTAVCDEVGQLAQGANVVVHEAIRRDQVLKLVEFAPQLAQVAAYHADTVQLGEMMERFEVPTVVLTHLIPAPGGNDLLGATTEQDFIDDLRSGGYSGRAVVASDLTSVRFPD